LPQLEVALRGAPRDLSVVDRLDASHLAPLAPIDDVRASGAYRNDAVMTLLRRLLRSFAP
jgi:CO/xanthine dehydrogenase FAD-binding subunit